MYKVDWYRVAEIIDADVIAIRMEDGYYKEVAQMRYKDEVVPFAIPVRLGNKIIELSDSIKRG